MKRPEPVRLTSMRSARESLKGPPVLRVKITREDDPDAKYELEQTVRRVKKYHENPIKFRETVWRGLENCIVLGLAKQALVAEQPNHRELFPIAISHEMVITETTDGKTSEWQEYQR